MTMPVTRRALASMLATSAATAAAVRAPAQSPAAPGELAAFPPDTVLPAGLHRVRANLTIKGDLVLLPGARIDIAHGATLTVLGAFSAPVGPVFSGGGRADLNRSRTPAAHPEWFGAKTDNGAADCLPALRACLAAHPVMHLRAADYWMSDTFVVDRPFVRIRGAGYRGADQGQGTRLLVRSGSADVLRVGRDRAPGSVNDFLQGVDIRGMELGRTMPVAPGARGEPAGLRLRYVLHCQFEGLSARESGIGFTATGAVRTYLRDCIAFRSLPGTTPGTWRGFQLGGFEEIGLAGTNGSVFVTDCSASIGGAPGVRDSVGLLLEGGFADTFVINFEATALETGIRIDGAAARMGGRAVSGQANLHLRMPVIDQCGSVGIDVHDTSEYALIELTDPYVAVAPGAAAAIRFAGTRGATTITGGQLIGRSASGNSAVTGLHARSASGIDVTGLKIADFARPVSLTGCTGIALAGQVHNPLVRSAAPAVFLQQCHYIRIALGISGQPRAFATGVILAEAPRGPVSIDAALIEDAAIGSPPVTIGREARSARPGRDGQLVIIGR